MVKEAVGEILEEERIILRAYELEVRNKPDNRPGM
jgi:hypothetical protein